jgi:hypothetical protein
MVMTVELTRIWIFGKMWKITVVACFKVLCKNLQQKLRELMQEPIQEFSVAGLVLELGTFGMRVG